LAHSALSLVAFGRIRPFGAGVRALGCHVRVLCSGCVGAPFFSAVLRASSARSRCGMAVVVQCVARSWGARFAPRVDVLRLVLVRWVKVVSGAALFSRDQALVMLEDCALT
jgi:hypothetical protein